MIVVFTALAGVARYANAAPLLAFGAATVALAGLAYVVSFATEQVGERFGPAVTGLLQSTLGNLPELFVVIFALRAGPDRGGPDVDHRLDLRQRAARARRW